MFKSILRAFRVVTDTNRDLYSRGENADLSCDTRGQLLVRMGAPPLNDTSYTAFLPAQYQGAVGDFLAALTQVGGFNDSEETVYVQLFEGFWYESSPFMVFLVPPKSSFSWEPSNGGYSLANGYLSWAVSSDRDTFVEKTTPVFVFVQGLKGREL